MQLSQEGSQGSSVKWKARDEAETVRVVREAAVLFCF